MLREGYRDPETGELVNPDGPLAGTKCPVTPGRLRELYLGYRREDGWYEGLSTTRIAGMWGVGQTAVNEWLKKCGCVLRDSYKERTKYAKSTQNIEHLRTLNFTEEHRERTRIKNQIYLSQLSDVERAEQRKKVAETKSRRYTRLRRCEYCGAEFRVHLSVIKREWGRFCSLSCKAKARRGRKTIPGIWCPRCFQELLRKGGKCDRTGKDRYICICCNRQSINPLTTAPSAYDVAMAHERLRAQGIELKPLPGLEARK